MKILEWNKIYDLKLGEWLEANPNMYYYENVTRVPGGWIYIFGFKNSISSTFIPFNNEFQ